LIVFMMRKESARPVAMVMVNFYRSNDSEMNMLRPHQASVMVQLRVARRPCINSGVCLSERARKN